MHSDSIRFGAVISRELKIIESFGLRDIESLNTRSLKTFTEKVFDLESPSDLLLSAAESGRSFESQSFFHENIGVNVRLDVMPSGNLLLTATARQPVAESNISELFRGDDLVFYILTIGGRILTLSSSVEQAFRLKRDELIGRNILEFYQRPEEREAYIQQLFQTGQVIDHSITLVHPEGGSVPCSTTAYLSCREIHGERTIVGIIRKLSNVSATDELLQQTRTAERQREQIFEAFFENNGIPILIIDPKTGDLFDANPTACEFYGIEHSRLMQMNVSDINMLDGATLRKKMACVTSGENVFRFKHKLGDGSFRDVDVFTTRLVMEGGDYLYLLIVDVTKALQSEVKLSLSGSRFEAIVRTMGEGIMELDEDLNILYVNPAAERILCIEKQDMEGMNLREIPISGINEEGICIGHEKYPAWEAKTTGLDVSDRVMGLITPSGKKVWLRGNVSRYKGSSEEEMMVISFGDITDLKTTQDELARRNAAFLSAIDGMALLDEEGRYVFMNQAHAEIYGYDSPDELLGKSWEMFYEDSELNRFHSSIMPRLFQHGRWRGEAMGRKRNGAAFMQELSLSMLKDGGLVCIVRDISQRKERDRTIEQRLAFEKAISDVARLLLHSENVPVSDALRLVLPVSGADRIYIFRNHRTADGQILMSQIHEACRMGVVSQIDNPELQNVPYSEVAPRWEDLLSRGQPVKGDVRDFPDMERGVLEAQNIVSILVLPIFSDGEWTGFIGFDMTKSRRDWKDEDIALLSAMSDMIGSAFERESRARALEREKQMLEWAEQNLEVAQSIAHLGSWEQEKDTGRTFWSDELFRILGYKPGDITPSWERFLELIHPDDQELVFREWSGGLERDNSFSIQHRLMLRDGSVKFVLSQGKTYAGSNKIFGSCLDITRRRQAEMEKAELEKQLQQAQRLETVGLLAGGIAHDFNNLLTPVIGYADMMLADESLGYRQEMEHIRSSAERAKRLTWQLMAFGRKQVINLKPVNIVSVVDGFADTFGRTVRDDIELSLQLPRDEITVVADKVQIEQVLLNMSINSQEAMPEGGRIRISVKVVKGDDVQSSLLKPASEYAMITFKDNGRGMDDSIKERIFEPFYSTKDEYRATGLGLSTVYGIVKQHSGQIDVHSKEGEGSVFTIFLPVVSKPERVDRKKEGTGQKTIMLVEDNGMVRQMVFKMLTVMGHKVLAYASAEATLADVESFDNPPELLLTDVIMPGIDGALLYSKLLQIWPDLKVLYMSGYTDNVIAHHGVLDEGVNFIQKPFGVKALSEKMADIL